LRNPWVRLRLLRCGWNVRFTAYLWSCDDGLMGKAHCPDKGRLK
jgi:hypothetical protein